MEIVEQVVVDRKWSYMVTKSILAIYLHDRKKSIISLQDPEPPSFESAIALGTTRRVIS